MKIKALLATLVGAVAMNFATAGEWCPPAKGGGGKCNLDPCCPSGGGSVSFGYDSDYVFKGVRLARDVVWADANYTFESLPIPVTFGIWHLSSLSSENNFGNGGAFIGDVYGDETNFYGLISLPSIGGFDAELGYTHFFFPTSRQSAGQALVNNAAIPGLGNNGDSFGQIHLELSRELAAGVTGGVRIDYLPAFTAGTDGFLYTAFAEKSICISDCIGLTIGGGVYYNDNYWRTNATASHGGVGNVAAPGSPNFGKDSGWHAYYLRAALDMQVGKATVSPYVAYNGTPDTWTGDDMNGLGGFTGNETINAAANRNDVLYWGISIGVGF